MTSYRGDPFSGNSDPVRQEVRAIHQGLAQVLELEGAHSDTLLLIVAALHVGANCRKVIRYTGLPWSFVRYRIKRLKKSGFWLDDGKIGMESDLTNDAEIATELQLMVLCAEGMAECTRRGPST